MELRAKITDAGVIYLPIEIRESFGKHVKIILLFLEGDLNKLEIILMERKIVSEGDSLPSKEKDIDIERRLKKACKTLDVKYGLFRQEKGKKKELIIKPYKRVLRCLDWATNSAIA